jgi:hypothetical protein
MNLVLALILAIIILLCMFLIPNKLIAVAVVLIVIIMLILARPGDFTLNHSYIVTQPTEEESEGSLAAENNAAENNAAENNAAENNTAENNAAENTAGNVAANAAAAAAAMGFESNSVEASNNMNSVFATVGDVVDGMDLSKNNVEKIGNTLENIDWGNILIKSLGNLQKYSENNGVSGTNNSKLNNNSASVESGSPANDAGNNSAGNESGSPESGSPESGSPESGSPESGSPESGSSGNTGNSYPTSFYFEYNSDSTNILSTTYTRIDNNLDFMDTTNGITVSSDLILATYLTDSTQYKNTIAVFLNENVDDSFFKEATSKYIFTYNNAIQTIIWYTSSDSMEFDSLPSQWIMAKNGETNSINFAINNITY